MLSIESKKLQTMIEDYVMYLRSEDKSYALINGSLCSLNLFFSMNDITLNWKKLKKLLPEKKKVIGYGWLDYGLVVENFRKSGWIVKDKGERESNYGTIRYILSHAGVKK